MKQFLLTSCLCVFAFPSMAQENAITIIRDDGSKEVVPLGEGQPSSPKDSVIMRDKPAPQVEVETAPVDVETVKPRIERVEAPAQQPKAAPVAAKPAPKPKVKAKPKPVVKKAAGPQVPKPMRKPHRRVFEAPSGEPISKDKALYIALSEAPPSRDMQVEQVQSDEGLAYSVVFRGEEGAYEVLIDAYSGVIIRSGAIENGQAVVQPGHLPVR